MGKSSYTREGVAASVRLASTSITPSTLPTWHKIESKYTNMLQQKGGTKLVQLDDYCISLREKLQSSSSPSITKKELLQVIEWKFTKGKARHALYTHLNSNSESSIKQHSTAAFLKAEEKDVKQAIECFCELKGVGPATASAFLSLYQPQRFAFMDDEVIECLYEKKRGYTVKIYLEMNQKCCQLAERLNKEEQGEKWTPWRVGKTLWTAARIAASCDQEEDLTLNTKNSSSKKESKTEDRLEQKKKKTTKQATTPKRKKEKHDKVVTMSKRTRAVLSRNAKKQKK